MQYDGQGSGHDPSGILRCLSFANGYWEYAPSGRGDTQAAVSAHRCA